MKVIYNIDGSLLKVLAMPMIGGILIDDEGDTIAAGTWLCPKCNCLIDTDSTGKVLMTFMIPMGFTVQEDEKIAHHAPREPVEGVSKEVFLKTVALLADKEKLSNIL